MRLRRRDSFIARVISYGKRDAIGSGNRFGGKRQFAVREAIGVISRRWGCDKSVRG
jgi:hypothetical protein